MHCKRAPERHIARGQQQISGFVCTEGALLKLYAGPATLLQCREAMHPQTGVHGILTHIRYTDSLLVMRRGNDMKEQSALVPSFLHCNLSFPRLHAAQPVRAWY